ncbi:hypothetical protein [Pinibacter aurantiacus]|uniref:Uncharacterized protein n=1 Tax=Pinibacter aurantiacus TaxID=2851599 RepID=A0A9E2S8M0_9BACT|nr:hypothetical protein [Pinibacter aurantiacus]MBV4357597.1 hypothetical protein [Pinibacter aurantiacus]
MTYDFFAEKEDKLNILDFIFNDTDLHVYDVSSAPDQQISEYKTSEDISSKFDLTNGAKFSVTFQLWSPRHNGKPTFRRISLDPKHCNGHTFRYATDGWGLIQLYFGGLKNNQLNLSHIGHFSEKGALKWQDEKSLNEPVSAWDWKEIAATSRKLKNHIHNKLAIKKIGSLGVLPGAEKLELQGVELK